jgi:glycosyltransferase involved in cell wall biosynthesis/Flp pilus assembly protein TadD
MEASDSFSPNSVYKRSVAEGRAFLDKKDFAKAADSFEHAVEIKGNEAELCFVLAALREKLSDPDRAERFYVKAVALRPNNFEYLYAYAMFLNNQSRHDEAIDVLLRCVKIRPDSAQLLNDIGVICNFKKDYTRATEFLTAASEKNPDYLVPLINLGYLYLQTSDLAHARELIEKLRERDPANKEIRELADKLAPSSVPTPEAKTELRFSDQSYAIAPIRMIEQFGQSSSGGNVSLSIVVPVFNEEDNLPVLKQELSAALKTLKQEYEIIFVDDGSTDTSRAVLASIASADPHVRVILFRRNYGQTAAIGAGFKYARGEVVITLDADLQNDPADIPKLLKKMAEGYDLVNGWRKDRQDKLLSRKIPSMIANRIINKLIEGTGVQLRDFGCTLKAYKKGIVKNIHLYGEMHRFIPVFAAWLGVKVTEIPVNHRPRLHGKAKYNLSRVSRVIFDLIVVRFFSDYMTRPIQFFGKIARAIATWGLLIIAILGGLGLARILPVSLNTVLILGALVLFSSMQMLTMGLLGELMIRFYFEGQRKDYYVVERILNDPEQQ